MSGICQGIIHKLMLYLKPVEFAAVSTWFRDYQKKSRNFEMPPEHAEVIGIYNDKELIGYFIVVKYSGGTVEINQGYLKPDARHKKNSYLAMKLLEDAAKQSGYKRILLGTNRTVNSYRKFMSSLGFEVTRTEFAKEI